MAEEINRTFVQQINANVGIAHKVCRIYFDDADQRADVLQEMMYQLWKAYPGFDGRSKFATWMYRVCLNTALGWRRKQTRRPEERLALQHDQIPEQPPEPREENIQRLLVAIGKLSALNKAIVLLYLDQLSYEEIASITGLTQSNVSVRLVRIKKELEQQLRKQEDVNT
jgi:RNA polymerase sigma-70 factor (ECF subfamily)